MTEEVKGRLRSLLSKKAIVWVAATVALFLGEIEGDSWTIITGVYLGVEVGQKLILK